MFATALLAMMVLTPTDQTLQVTKGTKLDINNFAGDVNVKVWDKDAVRVEVNHSDRETVDIKQDEGVVRIRSRSSRGPRSLDYTITVPSWMAVAVSGTYVDANLDGVGGDISIETTRGDIKVRGGSGFVSLKSVQGQISLEKAKGRIEVRAVNEGMHLSDISGDLSAETTNGSIILDRIDSSNVDLYTVNGTISYDGPIKDKGVYRLTTHSGMIAMAVPEKVNAMLTVRTYNGGFRSTFPIKLADDQAPKKRFTLTLGTGSAHVELESFGGTIALRRPGEARPEAERERRHRDGAAAPKGEDEIQGFVDDAMRDVRPNVDAMVSEAMAGMVDMQPAIDIAVHEALASVRSAVHTVVVPRPRPLPRPQP